MTRGEDGAGTVLSLALAGAVLLVACAVAGATAVVATHRGAQSAADLAALAGASGLQDGQDPCQRARRVARANGARLVGCAIAGWEVMVTASVDLPAALGRAGLPGQMRARSRAGPVTSVAGEPSG